VDVPSLSTPGLLSLTSGGRKNKGTEQDNKRLTLYHGNVEEKALVSLHSKNVGRAPPPGFVITDFRRWKK